MFPCLLNVGMIHSEHNDRTEKQRKFMAIPGESVGSGTGAGVIDA
jgi:hypothetical protein